MTEEQRRICLRAIDHYGTAHQKQKILEELGELIVELTREQDGRTTDARIREELADVIIMAEQLRIIYCAEMVDRWIEKKLARLQERMKEGHE